MKKVHPIVWGVLAAFLYWTLLVIIGFTVGGVGVILLFVLTLFTAVGGFAGFMYHEGKKKRK